MTTYTYSIQNNTANHKVNTNSLTREIQLSAIATALDHIGTVSDVLSIYFKADLSDGDKTVLDGVVSAHQALSYTLTPLVLYKLSPRIVGGAAWSADWILSPPAGYLYRVVRTVLVTDTTVDLSSATAKFIVNKAGDDGSITAERDYATLTDYLTRMATYQLVNGYNIYTWNYTPNPQLESSIPLRSSQNANITLSFLNNTVWTGAYASLTVVVISEPET